MTHQRSKRYGEIVAATHEEYTDNEDWDYAGQWRRRVGMTRLIAENCAAEAGRLLDDINASTFRNIPEIQEALYRARDAASEFYGLLARRNYIDFLGEASSDTGGAS